MKKTIRHFFLTVLLMAATAASAAPVFNMPVIRIQPNGDTLHCFVTGDEYYHRLHDADNYTIIQDSKNGYWVYADTVHTGINRWELVPTEYVAGRVDPHTVARLQPDLTIDRATWLERGHRFDVPGKDGAPSNTSGTNHGQLNNIVIFIRFSDQTEITYSFPSIDTMFNGSAATAVSMFNYFKKVSYNKINITTHYFPTPSNNSVVSYQDIYPRSYFQPYNSSTNTNGYQTETEQRIREFDLLQRAVNWVNANSPIPTSLNIDVNNDGKVDNICFVVKGANDGWNDLLWPHKWSLYDRYVYINGKRVYTFNLQLEGSGSSYFGTSTFCHEMFHTLGAPDLYRYYNGTSVSPTYSWDLMCNNGSTPQHMGAYMKWKYGNWLDSIPQITEPGTYTLHSLGDNTYDNCCYKIAAQEPNQWYVLEYRDKTEQFETSIPGTGLLIYRIDDRFNGNASFDGTSYFDEVYIFRPNGNDDATNGTPSQAHFSGSTSRTTFTPQTNPHPWLSGNVIDTTFAITDVTTPGATISFTYVDLRRCIEPQSLSASNLTGHSATLTWMSNAGNFRLEWRASGSTTTHSLMVTGHSHTLDNLLVGTEYQWRVKSLCSIGDSSNFSPWSTFTTTSCYEPQTTEIGTAETSYYYLPVNTYYNYGYSQMIYTAAELGGPLEITGLAFNYAGTNTVTAKTNCTIYLGTTTQSSFGGNTASNYVPFSQLQKVYEGPMLCTTGWNTFELDSSFSYNGTGNLVVAIDDNSGDYDASSYKFYCTSTSQYSSLFCYNDNANPTPATGEFSGQTFYRRTYRADIRFHGCPANSFQVTVSSNNNNQGSVTGGGSYLENTSATVTATPATGYHFTHWMSNGNRITSNPYTFTVTANRSLVAYFAIDTFTVTTHTTTGGTVAGQGRYTYGSVATVTATPSSNYRFLRWSGNGVNTTNNPYSFPVFSNISLTAHFASNLCNVVVTSADITRGSVTGSTTADYLSTVNIAAIPNYGYHFTQWNDGNTANPRSIVLVHDTSFTAYFAKNNYSITLSVDNSAHGSVTGSGSYEYQSIRTLTATAIYGYHFTQWSDGNTDNPRTLTLTQDTVLTAYFTKNLYTITGVSSNTIRGSVTGGRTAEYLDTVTLTATANNGYHFTQWNDGNTQNPRTVTVTGNATYTASFEVDAPTIYTLTVISLNPSWGTVSGGGQYLAGSTPTITATASTGYHFVQWNDGSTQNPRTVTMTSDTTFTATFEANAPTMYSLTVISLNPSWGTVSGGGQYPTGSTATLTATASSGYRFAHWNDGNTLNPRTVTVTGNAVYLATFEAIPVVTYTLTVLSDNPAWGTVTGSGTYTEGSTVTLTATPANGYHFTQWNDGNSNNPRIITLTKDTAFTASFAKDNYSISLSVDSIIHGSVTGAGTYEYLDTRTISATANYGYHFTQWNDGNTSNPRVITLTRDTSFTAQFAKNLYTLTGLSSDAVRGSVTGGVTAEYLETVTLTATPNYGYHFTQWNDGNTNNPRSVILTQNITFTAYFAKNNFTIALSVDTIIHGNVTGSGTYEYLDTRTISATANYGYHFTQWSDGNTSNPRVITLTQDTSFTAQFAKNLYTLSVRSNDSSMGEVTGSTVCEYLDTVRITANTLIPHHHFVRWSDGSTVAVRDIVVSHDSLITAFFAIDTHSVTLTANNNLYGTTTGTGNYPYGTEVAIAASAANGYHFAQWSTDSRNNPDTITITCDTTLTAIFTEDVVPEICMVTVQNSHNAVYWDKDIEVTAYNIYRENNETNEFELVATVPYSSPSIWIDTASQPSIRNYRYRMTVTDIYNYESAFSSIHQTMYLTINQDMSNGLNLAWTEYEGANYNRQVIYRGTNATNIQAIDTLSHGSLIYSDVNVPAGQVFYQVGIMMANPCNPSEMSTICLSNIATVNIVGINEVSLGNVKAFVHNGEIVMNGVKGQSISVYDMIGRQVNGVIKSEREKISIAVPAAGVYLVKIGNLPTQKVVVIQ